MSRVYLYCEEHRTGILLALGDNEKGWTATMACFQNFREWHDAHIQCNVQLGATPGFHCTALEPVSVTHNLGLRNWDVLKAGGAKDAARSPAESSDSAHEGDTTLA